MGKQQPARSLANSFEELDIDAEELDMQKAEEKEAETSDDMDVLDAFKQKVKKRKTVEETHKRETFLLDKELLKRVDKIARKQPRGFKTFFYNKVIEAGLKAIENEKKDN
jgi:hypothetical protein